MKEMICLYCFKSFTPVRIQFRCENNDVDECPLEEDRPLKKYLDKKDHPLQQRVFSPSQNSSAPTTAFGKGLSRMNKLFASDDQLVKSAICQCGFPTKKRVCPHCHNTLPIGFGEAENKIIALIGSRASGKSHYIAVLINELNRKIASQFYAAFTAVDEQTIQRYRIDFWKKIYAERIEIRKTISAATNLDVRIPLIYRLDTKNSGLGRGDIRTTYMVFFDTAGDDLINSETMERITKYIAKSDGIIFLLDPLQIPSIQDLLRKMNIPLLSEKTTDTDPQEIIIRAANLIRRENGMPLNKMIKTPIAFTFSKIDALFPLLDQSDGVRYPSSHEGFFDLDDFAEVDGSMRMYLDKWIGPGFDMFIKLHFENHAYFGLSALGSAPRDGKIEQGVAPHRVADPFLWLLTKLGLITAMHGAQAPLNVKQYY